MPHPVNDDMECWRAPQSPFPILYARLVLEQIRVAVVDAYFLVPHGGVEIGGVLLGKYVDGHVEVIDHEPIECEYVFGPSFSLSSGDEERLKDVLAEVREKSGGLEPVGWYHSHTRSEIFLTEADVDIHDVYFPEMWQVALVVRPSNSEPARAGFFFRELGGSIHASASYHEFQLEPLRGRPACRAEGEARALLSNGNSKGADPAVLPAPESKPRPVIGSNPPPLESSVCLAVDSQPKLERQVTSRADLAQLPKRLAATTLDAQPSLEPSAVSTLMRRVDSGSKLIELPSFCRIPPQARWTRVLDFVIKPVCLALALGGLAYVARDAVLPMIGGRISKFRVVGRSPEIGPAMRINAIDDQEFQIRWDTGSPAVREARSAVLAIVDGGVAQRIPLDGPHLRNGAFNFRKHSGRVDARLTTVTTEGSSVEAATMLLGPPSRAEEEPTLADAGAATLARQIAQLRRKLDKQVAQNKTLQVQLDQLRQQRATDTAP